MGLLDGRSWKGTVRHTLIPFCSMEFLCINHSFSLDFSSVFAEAEKSERYTLLGIMQGQGHDCSEYFGAVGRLYRCVCRQTLQQDIFGAAE